MGLRPFPGGDAAGRYAVVHQPVPRIMGHRVNVGDGLAVEYHADELTRPAPGVAPFRRVGIAAFAAVHHEPLHLVGNVGSHLGSNWAGATDGHAFGHQPDGPLALLRADEVQATELVVRAPAAPVLQRVQPLEHLRFIGNCSRHYGVLLFQVVIPSLASRMSG